METAKLRVRRGIEKAAKERGQETEANAITGSEIKCFLYLNEFDSGVCLKMVDVRASWFTVPSPRKPLEFPQRLSVCNLHWIEWFAWEETLKKSICYSLDDRCVLSFREREREIEIQYKRVAKLFKNGFSIYLPPWQQQKSNKLQATVKRSRDQWTAFWRIDSKSKAKS